MLYTLPDGDVANVVVEREAGGWSWEVLVGESPHEVVYPLMPSVGAGWERTRRMAYAAAMRVLDRVVRRHTC